MFKMNTGFIHSHRFKVYDDAVYSDGKLPYKAWLRYLRHFDTLTVMSRYEPISNPPEHLNLSSGEKVSFDWLPDLNNSLYYISERRLCRELISKNLSNLDAVIIRSSSHGWIAVAEAAKRNIPWAVEVVGDPWNALWNYGNLAGKLFAPIAWWQARTWIKKAPFAIYVTSRQLQRRYPCPGKTSYASNVEIRPVDIDVLNTRLSSLHCNRKNQLKCGMIGSLVNRYKGLHVAIRALQALRQQGTNVHLHVLGAGKHEEWVSEASKAGVSDLLHLDGCLSAGSPVIQWLDKLDFYIQPSLTEGLPRALIEAMSRGLPALASTAGGIPELLPSEALHKPGDHKKLAADIKRMVEDKDWRLQMVERNFNEAKQYYADVVSARRDEFWSSFAEYARQQKKSREKCASSS